MRDILKTLFEKSIALGDEEYTEDQIQSRWIGNPPATENTIQNTENRLGLQLPTDYLEVMRIANGFPTSSNSVEPAFQRIEDIGFYRDFEWNVIEVWKEMDALQAVVVQLEKAIIIAGREDEQQFLLIPPDDATDKWKYWKFAMWIPGEEEYPDLKTYFESVIEFLDIQIQKR